MKPGRYVSGHELAEAGLAELVDLAPRTDISPKVTPASKRKPKK